jgi:uncharacterized protein (TIGR00288 family)
MHRKDFVPPKVKNDLTSKLRNILKKKKVGLFIDAANLYYAANVAHLKIDFEQMFSWFGKNCEQVNLNFYTAFNPEDANQIEFLDDLAAQGYHVVKKPIRIFNDMTKGNMDIELAVDALMNVQLFDVFVLISGDGDFQYLVRALEGLGKQTVIIGVGGFTSFDLHQEADNYFFMNRISAVWASKQKKAVDDQKYVVFLDETVGSHKPLQDSPSLQKEKRSLEQVALPEKTAKHAPLNPVKKRPASDSKRVRVKLQPQSQPSKSQPQEHSHPEIHV